MAIRDDDIQRIAILQPGDAGRRWLCAVRGLPGPWVVEDRVEAFWIDRDWALFRATRARLSAVDSPFLAATVDVESSSVTLERWVTGPSLMVTGQAGALDPAVVYRVACQVATGLAQAHAVGINGQWLSPWDIVLNPLGVAQVTRVLKAPVTAEPAAADGRGRVRRSPTWLSPEVLRGDESSPASDVFALGAMLYWALEGAAPFAADTVFAQMQRTLSEQPARLSRPEIPERVDVLVRRMLAKHPADRPSARRVAEVLGRECGGALTPVHACGVSEALERLRASTGAGDIDAAAALLELRPELAADAAIRAYIVPHALDEPAFRASAFSVLSWFAEEPAVTARLREWIDRELDAEPVETPGPLRDTAPFRVEAHAMIWDDASAAPTCEACGATGIDVDTDAIEHADDCPRAHAQPEGFWDRWRRRLQGG